MTGKEYYASKSKEEQFALVSEFKRTDEGRRLRRFTVVYTCVFCAGMLAILAALVCKLFSPALSFDPQPIIMIFIGVTVIINAFIPGFYNRLYRWIEKDKM